MNQQMSVTLPEQEAVVRKCALCEGTGTISR
jgi:hypothetical protein